MLFQSARRVIACYAGFEEGRSGKPSAAPAEQKAATQHAAIYDTAKAWGVRFGVKKLDEPTATKLVEALSGFREELHFLSLTLRHSRHCTRISKLRSRQRRRQTRRYWVLGLTCLEWHELVPDEVCPWGKA